MLAGIKRNFIKYIIKRTRTWSRTFVHSAVTGVARRRSGWNVAVRT